MHEGSLFLISLGSVNKKRITSGTFYIFENEGNFNQSMKAMVDGIVILDCVGKISGIIFDSAWSGICFGLKLKQSPAYAMVGHGSGNTIEAPIQPRWCFQKTGS